MSLFGLFQKNKLNQKLAANSPANEDDVTFVKHRLKEHGYYDEPSYGMTPYPDNRLFDGIKKFQRESGLAVDGVMYPDGETFRALRRPVQLASNFKTPEIVPEKEVYYDTFNGLKEKRKLLANALNKQDVNEHEFNAVMKTYDFEGGDKEDGNTVSGITKDTLRYINNKYKLGFSKNVEPKDLTPAEKARAITTYGLESFERIGGRKAFEQFPDQHAADTFFDTAVRHGADQAGVLTRKALNRIRKNDEVVLPEEKGRIGETTFLTFLERTKDPERRKAFYDALAEEREKDRPGEIIRYNHFRIKE